MKEVKQQPGGLKMQHMACFFKRQARKDPECKMMIKNISMGSACCEMISEIKFGGLHCALSVIIQGRARSTGGEQTVEKVVVH